MSQMLQYDSAELRSLVREHVHSTVARDVDDALRGYSTVSGAVNAILTGTHAVCSLEERFDATGVYNARTGHWEALLDREVSP